VSIFLTETDTRHSLLHKQKHFRDKVQTKLTSNSSKLVGASQEAPIDVDAALFDDGAGSGDVPILLREDSEEQDMNLYDIPALEETEELATNRRPKRRRAEVQQGGDDDPIDIDADSSDGDLFVGQDESEDSDTRLDAPPSKRHKDKASNADMTNQDDKKKKLAMDISYEGFAIYGRVLCLVVKRRAVMGGHAAAPPGSKSQTGQPGGQAMMENWITSTQLPEAGGADDEAL